jgi:hypothetical protein
MIFAFLEDGTLEVLESEADAQRDYERIDVESGTVRLYDEAGVFLEPRIESGTYKLVPNPNAHEDSFALALYETAVLQPNRWFSSLDELKKALASRGVEVEFPSSGP